MSAATPALIEPEQAVARTSAESAAVRAPAFQIPSLDGIRAISFMTVFLAHAGLGSFVPGYFGLNLFFFLSGYLITTLMRMEFDSKGDVSFREFYLRRALRILPPFYLVLLVAYALTLLGVMGGSLSARAVLAQVFHVTNYYIVQHGWWEGLAPGTWVYWSLAVEEHFYLFFPLVFLWSRRRFGSGRDQALFFLSLCAVVLAWRCVLIFGFDVPKERTYVASDTRVDSILAGCILAVYGNPTYEGDARDDRKLLLLWLPLGFIAVVVSLVVRLPSFEQTFRYTLQSFGLMPFFMAAMRFHDRFPFRLLNWKPVRRLGVYSYSMYLMHTSLLWGFEQWVPARELWRSTAVLFLLVVLAALINKYVEKPFAEVRRRLAHYAPAAPRPSKS